MGAILLCGQNRIIFFEDYFKEHGHQVLNDHMPHVDLP